LTSESFMFMGIFHTIRKLFCSSTSGRRNAAKERWWRKWISILNIIHILWINSLIWMQHLIQPYPAQVANFCNGLWFLHNTSPVTSSNIERHFVFYEIVNLYIKCGKIKFMSNVFFWQKYIKCFKIIICVLIPR
jgi:hypothetical protein